MLSKNEILDWLMTLPEETILTIGEDGMTLVDVEHPEIYLEVGGIPDD